MSEKLPGAPAGRVALDAKASDSKKDTKPKMVACGLAGGVSAAAIVEIWKKTIDVQQHFNDLGMKVRNFGLTLLVGVLGGTALAVKDGFVVPLGAFGRYSLASLV